MKLRFGLLLCVISFAAGASSGQSADVGSQAPTPGSWQRLDTDLGRIVLSPEPEETARSLGIRLHDERIAVELVVDPPDVNQLAVFLRAHGADRVAEGDGVVEADVPLGLLAELERHPQVIWVRLPAAVVNPEPGLVGAAARPKQGVISEGLAAINVEAWHADGFTGAGVKVGIIDIEFFGWESLLGSELPPQNLVHFQSFGAPASGADQVHGTAVAEIVHDVAPDAELYLAHMGSRTSDFTAAVQWMINSGVRSVAMSVSVFGLSPGDGTGTFQSWIDSFVQQADGVWAHSAGNYRQSHWQGQSVDADGNGWVEMFPGLEIAPLSFTISPGENIRFSLQWNDWSVVNQDYSLHIFRIDGAEPVEVASANSAQSGIPGQRPTEWLDFTVSTSGHYGLGIFRRSADQINDMEIFSVDQWPFSGTVIEGSLSTPGDASGAMTTAASGYTGFFTVRSFSSAGPTNGPGGSLDGGIVKPDITAYDDVSTASYGTRAFPGTSAAAPHVAGAAAVVMSANPGWSGEEVRAFLESSAIDKGSAGRDIEYGEGRLNIGNSPLASCSFSVDPLAFELGSHGGGGIVDVATDAGCFWTAETGVDWIMMSTDNGTGTGRLIFTVGSNNDPEPRQGTMDIAGHQVTVNQQASSCSYSISPTSAAYTADGGEGEVEVSTAVGCSWEASSALDWIEITGGASGSGSGTVSYRVAPWGSDADRFGEMTVAGHSFTVAQAGFREGLRYLVAGIAEISGAAGTNWKSNLAVANLSGVFAPITIIYRHAAGESEADFDLADGAVIEFENPVANLFGDPGTSGAVELSSQVPLVVTARTFNDVSGGSYGQYLPGVEADDAISGDQVGALSQLRSNDDFRTNVGFVSFAQQDQPVRIRLFDGGGLQRGSALSDSVPPGGWIQLNRVFHTADAGDCSGCYALVDLVGGTGGPVWAYASIVDNSSGDPTTIPTVIQSFAKQGGHEYLVAGIAQIAGAAGTNWKSNVAALNLSGEAAQATLDYRWDGGTAQTDFALEHGELVEWTNLADLLGAPNTAGAVEISSDVPLIVTARTFNEVSGGTFGQFLPGLEVDQSIQAGQIGILSQIKRTDDFRTNIGFTNYGDDPCEVRIRLYGEDGAQKGSDLHVTGIPVGGWSQLNRVFQAAGVDSCPIGYATVEVLTTGCQVWAYASVVDNNSGDPTTVPLAISW